jgi:hypothetical protein
MLNPTLEGDGNAPMTEFSDDLNACAKIVEQGDPDRFSACMALPVGARKRLFPLYAFNVEVARAPWVTKEPMIAQMRLQWWADALAEISDGGGARRHEVVTPLAQVLTPQMAQLLVPMVEARRWDIDSDPFDDAAAFDEYLDNTGGALIAVAAKVLGASDDDAARTRQIGRGIAIANWLRAIAPLEAAGRKPLVDGRSKAVAQLATVGLDLLAGQRGLSKPARQALISGWRARTTLRMAAADPLRVGAGALDESEASRRWRLLVAALLLRI